MHLLKNKNKKYNKKLSIYKGNKGQVKEVKFKWVIRKIKSDQK